MEKPTVPVPDLLLELAVEFERALRGHRVKYVPGLKATYRRHHEVALPEGDEVNWRERYVLPAAETLAADVRERGVEVLTDIPVTPGVWHQHVSGDVCVNGGVRCDREGAYRLGFGIVGAD